MLHITWRDRNGSSDLWKIKSRNATKNFSQQTEILETETARKIFESEFFFC